MKKKLINTAQLLELPAVLTAAYILSTVLTPHSLPENHTSAAQRELLAAEENKPSIIAAVPAANTEGKAADGSGKGAAEHNGGTDDQNERLAEYDEETLEYYKAVWPEKIYNAFISINEGNTEVTNSDLNFDETFKFADLSWAYYADEVQDYIDRDYDIYYCGDYFHHNTDAFEEMLQRISEGTKINIGGRSYVCLGKETAKTDGYYIVTESGNQVFDNDTVEIITCVYSSVSPERVVVYLQEV